MPKLPKRRITYQDLLDLAKSGDSDERKRGFELFQAWCTAAPKLHSSDRLTHTQRSVLQQLFTARGFRTASANQRRG